MELQYAANWVAENPYLTLTWATMAGFVCYLGCRIYQESKSAQEARREQAIRREPIKQPYKQDD